MPKRAGGETFDVSEFTLGNMARCGDELQRAAENAAGLRAAAEEIVSYIHERFRDPVTGAPAFPHARVLLARRFDRLPGDLQEQIRSRDPKPAPGLRCLTVLATDGPDLPAGPELGALGGDQAVPVTDAAAVARAPVVSTLLGAPAPDDVDELASATDLVLIPPPGAAAEGIDPRLAAEHEIRSILGFGGGLPHGDAFAVVLFAKTPLPPETATRFRPIAANVRLGLLGHLTGADDPAVARAAEKAALAQLLALRQAEAERQVSAVTAERDEAREQAKSAVASAEMVETLRNFGTALAGELEIAEIAQQGIDAATKVTGAAFGAFFVAETRRGGEAYTLASTSGVTGAEFAALPIPRGAEAFGAFPSNGAVRSADVTAEPWFPGGRGASRSGAPRIRSYLAVPVQAGGGSALGAFFLGHPDWDVFGTRATQLAQDVAAQTAAALGNARLRREQRMTSVRLQQRLLSTMPRLQGLRLVSRYHPAVDDTELGGSWLDVIPLSAGRTALVVGDVVTRGSASVGLTGHLHTAIRSYAVMDLQPADVLRNLTDLVGNLPGGTTATCVYAVHDSVTGSLRLASGGHPPPVLVAPDGTVSMVEDRDGPSLGLQSRLYEEVEVPFPVGSAVLLYTPGLLGRRIAPPEGIEAALLAEVEDARFNTRGEEALGPACDALVKAFMTEPATSEDVAILLAQAASKPSNRYASQWFPGRPAAAAEARAFVSRTLDDWGLSVRANRASAIAGELVANAIEHAGTRFEVRLHRLQGKFTLEVADSDGRLPRIVRASPFDSGRRGLLIVETLSDRWGARPTSQGKVVWAEMEVTES